MHEELSIVWYSSLEFDYSFNSDVVSSTMHQGYTRLSFFIHLYSHVFSFITTCSRLYSIAIACIQEYNPVALALIRHLSLSLWGL